MLFCFDEIGAAKDSGQQSRSIRQFFNLLAGSSGDSVIVTRLERPSNAIIQFRRISLPIKQA
jgi:hypothetical protein